MSTPAATKKDIGGFTTKGYVDDKIILDLMQSALEMIQNWCAMKGLLLLFVALGSFRSSWRWRDLNGTQLTFSK